MTNWIFTPFTLVAVMLVLACILAVLFFLSRPRSPGAEREPNRPQNPTRVVAPPVLPPEVAAMPAPSDGPALPRTVLETPPTSATAAPRRVPFPAPRTPAEVPGAGSIRDAIEHRERAAKTRLKGPDRAPDDDPADAKAPKKGEISVASRPDRDSTPWTREPPPEEVITEERQPSAFPQSSQPDEWPEDSADRTRLIDPAPPPRPAPVTKPVEPDTPPVIQQAPIGGGEERKTGSLAPAGQRRPQASPIPKPEPIPVIEIADSQATLDIVDCSVFAPPRIAAGERFVVQAHLHLAEQVAKVRRAAAEIDRRANLQGSKSLLRALARGTEVELYLVCPGLIIGEPWQTVSWQGTPARVLFNVEAPADLRPESIDAAVYLSLDGIPVGDVAFRMHVAPASVDETAPIPPPDEPAARTRGTSYGRAFISYARKDFDQVSLFAQGLTQNDVKLAFDVVSLEPGADWAKTLPSLIEGADVFYLMWSDSAAQSKMVEKEARLAVWLHHKSRRGEPRIVPITLHRPVPKPPTYLSPFHFDSPWLAHRVAQAMPLFRETSQ